MAAPDPVGPQSAPSHMKAHQECGWKDGVQAVHKSTVNSLDRECLLMEARNHTPHPLSPAKRSGGCGAEDGQDRLKGRDTHHLSRVIRLISRWEPASIQ
jgi:hypothetical protein